MFNSSNRLEGRLQVGVFKCKQCSSMINSWLSIIINHQSLVVINIINHLSSIIVTSIFHCSASTIHHPPLSIVYGRLAYAHRICLIIFAYCLNKLCMFERETFLAPMFDCPGHGFRRKSCSGMASQGEVEGSLRV